MKRLFALTLVALGVCLMSSNSGAEEKNDAKKAGEAISFTMKSLDGKEVDLKSYAGKVVLVVNTASKCGLTNQYKDLQALHEKYKDKGLAVLGFPCNQFLGQEPGDSKQISEFCTKNYGVTFDMFDKIDVNKDGACALYKYLTAKEAPPVGKGPVSWNFEKFLINRDGELVNRFAPTTKPSAEEVVAAIEKELAAK
jgi:glutathione peroxidase